MWGYRQVLTIAQIELLSCDVPLVVSPPDKDKPHTKREMEELTKKWQERHGRDFCNGKRFNMNDFLRTGKID